MIDATASGSPTLSVDAEGVGFLTFDDPARPLNVLTEATMRGLAERIAEVEERAGKDIRVLVIRSGKPHTFIAGADLDAIEGIEDPADGAAKSRLGQAVYLDIERLPIPTVAAIDGLCLGGGTELALACRFRLCSDHEKTRIGLPEVQLGLLPGWGGTTRLPRLIGLKAALPILLTGDPIRPARAERIGLVSDVLPSDLFEEEVRDFALAAVELERGASRKKRGLFTRLLDDTLPGQRVVLAAAKRDVQKRTGGHYPAPLAILDVLRRSLRASVADALAEEARAFGELTATAVHHNLFHLFRLREAARKTASAVPGAEPRAVERLGVVGAGVMGGGVAQLAAYHDIEVRLKDIRDEAVASGLQHARGLFDKAVERRKLSSAEASRKMALIAGGIEYHGFQTLDLVIEAVVERLDVKRDVLSEIEDLVPEHAVLATNTSSLSVDEMAAPLRHPERFCGIHFFNPVHKMPLVEVVRGAATDDRTVATAHALAVAMGKVPVICRDAPGFLVNRILGPYLNEAGWLLADGASIEAIDEGATGFGMPMGPLRLIDEIGLDIARHAGETLHAAFGDRLAPSAPLAALADTDRLGRKNGRGFYRYEGGQAEGPDDSLRDELGLEGQGSPPDEAEIRLRLVLAMINEAARVLDEGVVPAAADVDVGMIMGTGFPPFRGGLLRFADTHHPRSLLERLQGLERRVGPRFAPAPLLVRLADEGRSFYEAFPSDRKNG